MFSKRAEIRKRFVCHAVLQQLNERMRISCTARITPIYLKLPSLHSLIRQLNIVYATDVSFAATCHFGATIVSPTTVNASGRLNCGIRKTRTTKQHPTTVLSTSLVSSTAGCVSCQK
jgi:hypothetical protein